MTIKTISALLLTTLFVFAHNLHAASSTKAFKFEFKNEELTKMIETYAKATGQKFVIDPSVRGKASILVSGEVSGEEAFNQLSSALALNGFAVSEQGDTMVVISARNAQRSLHTVLTELPTLKPERMLTWVVTLKYANAEDVLKQLRILPSKDGEMTLVTRNNQLIFSDWASNLHRIQKVLAEIDVSAKK